jgi:Na+-driven multidrug efflux pump
MSISESKYSRGDLKSLWLLFLPLVGTSFFNYIFILLEKIFLSRVSSVAMEAALNATYACQIFQIASIALVMMAQVYVARNHSAQKDHLIGPGIWQFVWFSLLSMMITVPANLCYGLWFFHGTEIEKTALPYFYLLTAFNFLYPIGTTLACFFTGQGKIKFVLLINLATQLLKIILAYLLIFGLSPWISPLGILGGAISNLFSQALLCLILGIVFLQKKYKQQFHSHEWKLNTNLFWDCIKPGLFRALNRVFSIWSWTMIAHLMTAKGGDYLLILSLGGTFSLFLPFLFDAIYQAQTVTVSHLIGSKKFFYFPNATRSGIILVSCLILFISIPFLIFPESLFHLLFPSSVALSSESIRLLFLGIWLWGAYFTLAAIPLSYIMAFQDTKFYFLIGLLTWPIDYFLMRFFIETIQIQPDLFWILLSLVQMISLIPFYFSRMKFLCDKAKKEIAA